MNWVIKRSITIEKVQHYKIHSEKVSASTAPILLQKLLFNDKNKYMRLAYAHGLKARQPLKSSSPFTALPAARLGGFTRFQFVKLNWERKSIFVLFLAVSCHSPQFSSRVVFNATQLIYTVTYIQNRLFWPFTPLNAFIDIIIDKISPRLINLLFTPSGHLLSQSGQMYLQCTQGLLEISTYCWQDLRKKWPRAQSFLIAQYIDTQPPASLTATSTPALITTKKLTLVIKGQRVMKTK